ncbi:RNA polymerase sigma-70 factor [Bacteroides sp. UBA939]|uniref:RNA polymerase sigma-70 factor n=1 Tax=Bacteroides sp. UBA939 TaxID=1946092 RepID=UPI0025C24C1C|nr:RNA polymerase sigma-70 factor [Bacteroides sp. UBA939]
MKTKQGTRGIIEENVFLQELKHDNENAFAFLFKTWYKDLVIYAAAFIQNKEKCEDMVQNTFLKLWENRKSIEIETSLRAYLLKSVRNNCIDYIRHESVERDYEEFYNSSFSQHENMGNYILYSELSTHLNAALDKLDPVVKEAFELSRFSGLKYKDIALKQQVSERSVEVRISKALQYLRIYLKEYLVSIVIVLKYLLMLEVFI